ncbi:MAG TPA: PAS domain S-box protein [Stellaceae bacterium]|nr:PAS domain S-box protein [Stellaceae bacterium]
MTPPTARPEERTRREVSQLVALVAAAVLPVLVFSATIAVLYGERQRAGLEAAIGRRADRLRARLDARIAAETNALEVLAASPSLDRPDLAKFRTQAERITATVPGWVSVGLFDPHTGAQLFTTSGADGNRFDGARHRQSIFEAARTHAPQLSSEAFAAGSEGQKLIAIRVPVIRAGEVRAVLSASLRPQLLDRLLDRLPHGWNGALLDARRGVLARSRRLPEAALAMPALIGHLAFSPQGSFHARAANGAALYTAYRRSRLAPWTVLAAAPARIIDLPPEQLYLMIGGAGLIALAAAAVIAFVLGRALTRRKRAEEQVRRLEAESQLFDIAARNRELERSRAALELSESRSRAIANNAADGILMLDEGGLVASLNKAAEALFDAPRAATIGLPFATFLPEPDQVALAEILARHRADPRLPPSELIATGRRRDGGEFPLELRLTAFEFGGQALFAVTARDISERLRLERQLLQAQRMEAVGQLTGGLAHDFNNLLTVVLGNLTLIEEAAASEPYRRYAAAARRAAERGERLTSHLLAFGRRQLLRPKTVEINAVVRQIEPLIRHSAGEAITVELDLAADLWPSMVDESEFEVALLNLIVNARDAMPGGGRIVILTRNRRLDASATAEGQIGPGEFVEITVRDDGLGMSEDVKASAFEPFFTTKDLGRASGLGLSQVYGFVRQSVGQVVLDSAPEKGTRVVILLPRATAESLAAAAAVAPRRRRSAAG